MSIRLRLALLYSGLAAAVIASVVLTAYAVHGRNAYEDVDESLVNTAEHFEQVLLEGAQTDGASPSGGAGLGGSSVLVRLYDAAGTPLGESPAVPAPPPIDALEVIRRDEGPAYDRALRWLPGGQGFREGAFATERDAAGVRIRLYAVPVEGPEGREGYVQSWASLESLDSAMRTFRFLMIGLGGGGVLAVGLGSLLLAGRALSPVAAMTRTARAIAVSRGFSRRLPDQGGRDELSYLARTFNEMLASLEEAYRSQQRFVADASHELRAPLTAIQGNIELLSRVRDMPQEERAEAISYLETEVHRLSRMVGELLTLARADAGQTLQRRDVDLDAVLLDAVAGIRSAGKRNPIEVEAIEPLKVSGDPDRIKQLILILLDNAVKYSRQGAAVRIGLRRAGDRAILEVADKGIGIRAEDLPHIFERFYRADPARSRDPGGTGLGLSIARWIVDQHDGDITVDSHVGRGTTVTVRLPLVLALEPGTEPGRPDELSPTGRSRT